MSINQIVWFKDLAPSEQTWLPYHISREEIFKFEGDEDVIMKMADHERNLEERQHGVIKGYTGVRGSSLGSLDVIPLEIMQEICLRHMSLSTLFRFWQVNPGAREIIRPLPQYRAVVTHAAHAYRALIRTEIPVQRSLADLHNVLFAKDPSCSEQDCNNLGNLLHLYHFRRCCQACYNNMDCYELGMTTLRDAQWYGYILPRDYKRLMDSNLPVMRTARDDWGTRYRVIPASSVVPAAKPKWNRTFRVRSRGPYEQLCVVRIPALQWSRSGKLTVDHGVKCPGCGLADKRRLSSGDEYEPAQVLRYNMLREHVYSRDEFLKHAKHCTLMRELWVETHSGTNLPDPEGNDAW